MATLISVNLSPQLFSYTGPYKVGTIDVEIPVSDIVSSCKRPKEASGISTILFRIFYPATAGCNQQPAKWMPNHQTSAYVTYGQRNRPSLAKLFSYELLSLEIQTPADQYAVSLPHISLL